MSSFKQEEIIILARYENEDKIAEQDAQVLQRLKEKGLLNFFYFKTDLQLRARLTGKGKRVLAEYRRKERIRRKKEKILDRLIFEPGGDILFFGIDRRCAVFINSFVAAKKERPKQHSGTKLLTTKHGK